MIKKIILLAITVATTLSTEAEPVSKTKAQSFASHFFASHNSSAAKGMAAQPMTLSLASSDVNTMEEQGDPAYYIFNAINTVTSEKGFVIVSGDDRMPAFLGYSLDDSWPSDESLIPTPLRNALDNYAFYVEAVREGKVEVPSVSNDESDEGSLSSSSSIIVAPLLNTNWGQTYPYNKYAPIDPFLTVLSPEYGDHYPIGCAAVALGQVLNYWGQKMGKPEHPNDVKTFATYYETKTSPQDTLYYSLSSTTKYDYANMPDIIGFTKDTLKVMPQEDWEKKGDAVGLLLKDVAYSLNMDWRAAGGGSYILAAPDIAYRNFGFSLDSYALYFEDYGSMAKSENLDLIKADLDKGYPVAAGGVSLGSGGHAFVYDGYDSNDFVHVNWGWNGSCNNWFNLAYLKTDRYDRSSGSSYNFSLDQEVIINLHPKEEGAVEQPHLDAKNIQLQFAGYCIDNPDLHAVNNMKRMNIDGFQPVAYLDRDSCLMEWGYQASTCHKSFGYDYDIIFNKEYVDDGSLLCDTIHDTTTKDYGIKVFPYIVETAKIDTRAVKDGTYNCSGKMREILNGECGEWKMADANDSWLFSGNHIVCNPAAYNRYYHATNCIHHIQNMNNKVFVHMEYDRDVSDIKPGDKLNILLELQGVGTIVLRWIKLCFLNLLSCLTP